MHEYESDEIWKKRFPESIITWPVLRKQNIQTKKVYSHRVDLVHQHGRRFIVLEHQYGCLDGVYKTYNWQQLPVFKS